MSRETISSRQLQQLENHRSFLRLLIRILNVIITEKRKTDLKSILSVLACHIMSQNQLGGDAFLVPEKSDLRFSVFVKIYYQIRFPLL
jgi:hypothetical protein